jgi:hypothetical protein
MSDLKYQSVEQLQVTKRDCEKYIANLKSKLNGQNVRLEWINKYLFEKTPQELTIEQIEYKLGHKVIIK